jgi:hypothetical protein
VLDFNQRQAVCFFSDIANPRESRPFEKSGNHGVEQSARSRRETPSRRGAAVQTDNPKLPEIF